eukprot:2225900-Rhodomonas_salina.1
MSGTDVAFQVPERRDPIPERREERKEEGGREGGGDLEKELQNLLSFIRSGFTTAQQYENSEYLRKSSPEAAALRSVYKVRA